ncbi:MAG: helix-turn-helix transcriptional regulator [Variibacter sp.]|nr:helix-turn-helix transcriptional regulator [Variibacter sp.]
MLTNDRLPVDGASPPSPGVWLSVSALAKAKRISKQALSKRLGRLAGVVSTRREGRELLVNVVEYDRATNEHTDPAQALRGNIKPATAPSAGEEDDAGPSYTRSRALRETYQAENARLDLEERIGRLVDRAEVEHRVYNIFRRLRDRLLSLAPILSERVVAAPDARAARMIIDEEVRRMLDQLAAELDQEAEEEAASRAAVSADAA